MDDLTQQLAALLLAHKWVAAGALAVGTLVRLLKAGGPIPWEVPARARPWLALGLGIVAGCLQKVAGGATWQAALAEGVAAAFIAIVGHDLLVEGLAGGREVPLPAKGKKKHAPPKKDSDDDPPPISGPVGTPN